MPTIANTQVTPKNSRNSVQTTKRKVNIIEIDLTNSSNKVEDFRSRVKSSANNIDRFPEAEIMVLFEKEEAMYGRDRIQKFSILQEGSKMLIEEGDKRKRYTLDARVASKELETSGGEKSQWLLKESETIIVAMNCFYPAWQSIENYSCALGISKDSYMRIFSSLFPALGKRMKLERELRDATKELMATIKSSITEIANEDGYTVLRVNDWGVAVESKNGELGTAAWTDEDYFISFKHELNQVIRDFVNGNTTSMRETEILDTDVTISLVKSKVKNKVVLTAGNMEETFRSDDYSAMFLWVYINRHEIIKPKYEILSYVGLYGTDKVDDVIPIAQDVFQINYEFVRDGLTYQVVFRNDIGVTFTETSTEVINGTQFNNCRLVSFNWDDFQDWNNMPTDDMCSVELEWRVQDGKATLVDDAPPVENSGSFQNVA